MTLRHCCNVVRCCLPLLGIASRTQHNGVALDSLTFFVLVGYVVSYALMLPFRVQACISNGVVDALVVTSKTAKHLSRRFDKARTLAELLITAFDLGRRGGPRAVASVRAVARDLVTAIVTVTQKFADDTLTDTSGMATWGSSDHLSLPLLTSAAGRHKRISSGFKRSICEVANASTRLHSPAQILQAEHALNTARARDPESAREIPRPPQRGDDFVRDFLGRQNHLIKASRAHVNSLFRHEAQPSFFMRRYWWHSP